MDSRSDKSNHSLVDALAQLDIGGRSRGVINKLPNEMLRAILSRVQAPHVIRFRSVDKKWKAVTEDICREKKCLVVMDRWDKFYLSTLSNQFNGHLKLNHNFVFIRLFCPIYMPANLFPTLAHLFPQIEQFFTNVYLLYSSPEFISMLQQWSSTLTTLSLYARIDNNICDQINRFPNLKRLNLHFIDNQIANRLAPTLDRFEHFSGCGNSITEIVPLLGTRCTSLRIAYPTKVNIGEITNWLNVNPQLVSSLERLSLATFDPQAMVFSFICNHFSSLQMLCIDGLHTNVGSLEFTNDKFELLARLTRLTELRLDSSFVDMVNLDVANLRPLPNIRSFSLVNFAFVTGRLVHDPLPPNFDVQNFVRILSTIFPNVSKLTIKSYLYKKLGNSLEPHVNLFPNLGSHDFSFVDPIDHLLD